VSILHDFKLTLILEISTDLVYEGRNEAKARDKPVEKFTHSDFMSLEIYSFK
jgi:hypothetical protein